MAAKHRIRRGADYRAVVRTGYRVGGKHCLAHAVLLYPETDQKQNVSRETLAADLTPRFGFIITKAVGKAVTRNLVRRRMQSICDEAVREGFNGATVVFRVFPQAAAASYQELRDSVLKQLNRIRPFQSQTAASSGSTRDRSTSREHSSDPDGTLEEIV